MHRTRVCSASVLIAASWTVVAVAGDWPAFRGPHGNGLSEEKNLPTAWSAAENVRWKVSLPDDGNGSPVVAGDKVFITCGQEKGLKRGLYCYHRADGRLLWSRVVEFDKVMPTHGTNPHCATTPAVAGKRVVVWHGSAGLFCYDLDGTELWRRDLGEFRHMWGYAASPIIYKNLVVQNCAPGAKSFLAAFDLETGRDAWRVDEPADGNGEKRSDNAPMGTWTTPVVARIDDRDQIVCFQPRRVVGYDPANGAILWTCALKNHKGDLAYSSPIVADGVCVAIGGYSGSGMAFTLGGGGDLSKNQLWYKRTNPQSIGTGVVLDGYLYIPDAGPGTIRCVDVKTGDEKWTDRAAGDNHWGSISMSGDGLAYVTNQKGTTVVFRPNPEKFDLVSKNELGETCNATPALSDGNVFVRTHKHLYCIGK